jgi:hypothetical protein
MKILALIIWTLLATMSMAIMAGIGYLIYKLVVDIVLP